MKSCFVGLLCCFVGQYRLHIEGILLYWNGSGSAQEELSCHNQCLSMIISVIVHALKILRPCIIGCKCFNKLITRKNFGIKDACVR